MLYVVLVLLLKCYQYNFGIMGNHPSNHQPLDKAAVGKFGDVHARRSLRSPRKMDRLRKSFRDSFRKRKERVPESSKPHMWQADESAVRSATCTFSVKYLGCVEVFESRGMQVCEEAIKVLRGSRRRPVRATLHVSGDGLRVVEDETKGLIVDQTIEKVSFCAPDRNHERGFSYICRDGTTRRWMCHGFLAPRESGERLSHAVGCAFAVCLEKKQRRDKECGVTMTFDAKNNTFTRTGSFRTQGLTERLERGVDILPNNITSTSGMNNNQVPGGISNPSSSAVNPFAIERPHATPSMLERQGSFRGLGTLGASSPFKRQMSLRVSDLPSNAERLNQFMGTNGGSNGFKPVSPIPEVVMGDPVTALCQQLSQGLSQLTNNDDDFNFNSQSSVNQNSVVNQMNNSNSLMQLHSPVTSPTIAPAMRQSELELQTTQMHMPSGLPPTTSSVLTSPAGSATLDFSLRSINGTVITPIKSTTSAAPSPNTTTLFSATAVTSSSGVSSQASGVTISPSNGIVAPASSALPRPDQWLGNIVSAASPSPSVTALTSPVGTHGVGGGHVGGHLSGMRMMGGLGRRGPGLGAASRAMSLDSSAHHHEPRQSDPFDADWANTAATARQNAVNTNPFLSGALNTSGTATVPPTAPQAFQIQL